MKFKRFVSKYWKSITAIMAILIATVAGVAIVKAATVSISVDVPAINFENSSQVVTVNAQASIIGSTSVSGVYVWEVADRNVASCSNIEGVGTIRPLAGGKTELTVGILVDTDYASKTIPITVPLTINSNSVSHILQPGNSGTVTCNAAASKVVEWSSSNSNIATVTPSGSSAVITAVSGGTARITAAIPSDGLSASFDVTVGVTIDEDAVTVEQGQTTIVTTNSNSVSDVFWWSANEDIATVENGVITGVYAGTTQVYASCRDHDAENNAGDMVLVTVPYHVNVPDTTMLVGDRFMLTTTAKPSEVNFSSNNNNIVSYDSEAGNFVAHAKGTADITVSWNGNVQTVTVTVLDGFSLSNSSVSLNIGDSASVSAIITNSEAPVHWSVADPTMALLEVSEDGLTATVTALALGTNSAMTTLVATQELNGVVKTATCDVYILKPVTSLTLFYNGNEINDVISLEKGSGLYITAILNLGGADVPDNTKLSWVSSDSSVVSVEPVQESGAQQLCRINGISGGSATITVVSDDGLFIATADFYVTEGIQEISLDKTDVTAQMSLQRFQLKSTILPQSAGVDTSVTWASLDPGVVTVDQNGLVTFVAPGETYVSVTANADTTKVAYCKFIITQQVDGITLDFERADLSVGDEFRITYLINPANATNQNIIWSSSNVSVATVDETGLVKAVGNGSATIVAQTEDGGYIDMCNITVVQPVTSIVLSETEMVVDKGTQFWLNAQVLPETANNKNVRWGTSDSSLATVDETGKVTALGAGTVTISCVSEENGTVAYCVVDIIEPVEGLELNAYYQEMIAGTKFVIIPSVLPIDAQNKNVTYETSDPSIATVDEHGIVSAHIGGKCEIIVTTAERGLKKSCVINVKEYLETIKITDNPENMKAGEEAYLKAEVTTETATNRNVIWSSSNNKIATVDQTGHVTAKGEGSVVISATAADGGGVSDSIIIHVVVPVKQIKLSKDIITIYVGDTYNLKAAVSPANASFKKVNWTSESESIAKVYPNGDVVGMAAGRTVIHAVSTDGENVTGDCTVIVKEHIGTITIKDYPEQMNIGEEANFVADVAPETASNKDVIWTTSDPTVATVDSKGKVTATGEGKAVITATAADGGGASASVVIRVIIPVTEIKLSSNKITIFVGDTENIQATIEPPAASIKDIAWESDDEKVAKVYPNGDVVGISEGRTIVHAVSTDGNKVVADCAVIVKNIIKATSVSINTKETVMLKGKTRKLTARLYPINTHETVRWVSTDTSIVQVDSEGNIVTVGAGVCEVVAYSSSGSVEDRCKVYSYAMHYPDIRIEQYDTFNLYTDGAPEAVSWRSSNPRIASVDQNGVVTARMPGECVITATVRGKSVTTYVRVMSVDPGKFINIRELLGI